MYGIFRNLRLIIAWFSLLIGICIYLLFRSRYHFGFMVADALGLKTIIDSLRSSVVGIHLPDFLRFCLPDGLWVLSYILFISHIFRQEPVGTRMVWVSILPLIGLISELLQLAGLLPGVFDPLDLVAYLLPLILYIFFEVI